jgi:hypothetical protein
MMLLIVVVVVVMVVEYAQLSLYLRTASRRHKEGTEIDLYTLNFRWGYQLHALTILPRERVSGSPTV